MSELPASHHIDLTNTFGASLIGALVSAILYGLTTLQTYLFFVYYPTDPKVTKILVSVIWLLDTFHTAFISISVYHYLVTNYFNPPALSVGHWSLFLSVGINVVVACIVQSFFAIRIFQFCGAKVRWWVTSLISATVIAHFAFGMETVVLLFIKKELSKIVEINLFAAMPFALFAVLSDVGVAGALCILLNGSRTGFRKTDTILSKLITYAINRCLLTSIVAVIEVVVFSAIPTSLWYLAIDFIIGKLYANSLLATLNSRVSIRMANGHTINSVHQSAIDFQNSPRRNELKAERGEVVLDLDSANISQETGESRIDTDGPIALVDCSRKEKLPTATLVCT